LLPVKCDPVRSKDSTDTTACSLFCWLRSTVRILLLLTVTGLAIQSPGAQAAELSVRSDSVSEGQRLSNVRIELSEQSTSVVRVQFATAPDTATAGKDFYGVYKQLSFSPGVTIQIVPVVLLNDTELEGNERFKARIWDVEGSGVRIAQAEARITIIDNDDSDEPLLTVNSQRVGENAGSIAIDIRLSEPAAEAVTLAYATTAATATPGRDFYGTSGSLRFEPGVVNRSITIKILDDTVSENEEFFEIHLRNIVGASPASVKTTVTLVDDDSATHVWRSS